MHRFARREHGDTRRLRVAPGIGATGCDRIITRTSGDVIGRVERLVGHRRRHAAREARRVKGRDRASPTLAARDVIPEHPSADAKRRDDTDAGDSDALCETSRLLYYVAMASRPSLGESLIRTAAIGAALLFVVSLAAGAATYAFAFGQCRRTGAAGETGRRHRHRPGALFRVRAPSFDVRPRGYQTLDDARGAAAPRAHVLCLRRQRALSARVLVVGTGAGSTSGAHVPHGPRSSRRSSGRASS